ncbi:cation diffusion facilitator family transporter [Thermoactinomyces mirandus]|uniref:Cation transporter n=1 Tax=Thermoactinomyces mirandus TaxID=2756294 RepID=A0A7W1XUF5_9BACL|nr:cation diffusion facilitator family transporter [Thermoactinomyces mirandus]MBA4603474.1 cation transporter [Thermoactinomyces mirandus]
MIKFLIKKFVKDYQKVKDRDVRKSYGVLSGVIGIICNLLLFLVKIITGFMMNSIAVISDAFNNLSDTGSSLITIFGASLSNRPPDKEHPYGHGRYEYIASLVVAFIIFAVGLELLSSSFNKIINPQPVHFSLVTASILAVSILLKLWMYSYNRYIGKTINSSMNMATAKDSLNDVIATASVLIGTFIGMYVDFPVDGVLGLLIALVIVYTGFITAKDSVNLLLGPSPEPEILDEIEALIAESKTIKSFHDLKIHDYGPGIKIASMHAVVPPEISIPEAHLAIHEMEQKIKEELGIELVIHMDPSEDIDEKLSDDSK